MTAPEIQHAMHGLSPEYRKRYEDEQKQFYNDTVFELPEMNMNLFNRYRIFLGSICNETNIGITAKNYAALFFSAEIEQYNVGNMVSICQVSERATLKDYMQQVRPAEGINLIAQWCDLRHTMEAITQHVNDIILPFTSALLKKLLALQYSLDTKSHNSQKLRALL